MSNSPNELLAIVITSGLTTLALAALLWFTVRRVSTRGRTLRILVVGTGVIGSLFAFALYGLILIHLINGLE